MEIKEAILQTEKEAIKAFLAKYELQVDELIINKNIKTFYIEDNHQLIGTISYSDNIIKWIAIEETYQGENILNKLISTMIDYLQSNKIFYYQVFTKPIYQDYFQKLGFKLITSSNKVSLLEKGETNINDKINEIKRRISYQFTINPGITDVASIVINGNPLTNGHIRIIEEISKRHQYVIVFILEENKSLFSYQERYIMAYLACKKYDNVIVLGSTKYIISSLTFPSYFIKDIVTLTKETAILDATIFKDYFMKEIGIKYRYVGQETTPIMVLYNETLKEILQDKLILLPRYEQNGKIISASFVRELIKQGKIEEALLYIPKECQTLFLEMVGNNE